MGETAQTLLAKTDDELRKLMGLDQELKKLKEYLEEGAKLTGKAAKEFQRQLDDMLSPEISGSRMRWAVEDAKRAGMSKKELLDSDAPMSVMD